MKFQKTIWLNFILPLVKSEAVFSFYIEKKSRLNNLHIIHQKECELLPQMEGRVQLGFLENFDDAINKGKTLYEAVKLCSYCCSSE